MTKSMVRGLTPIEQIMMHKELRQMLEKYLDIFKVSMQKEEIPPLIPTAQQIQINVNQQNVEQQNVQQNNTVTVNSTVENIKDNRIALHRVGNIMESILNANR
jgi:hypothetical protein